MNTAATLTRLTALILPITALLSGATATAAPGDVDVLNANVSGGTVNVIAVQPDGKILIGGEFTQVHGISRNKLARLNPDGSLDTSFDPRPNNNVTGLAIQPDGKIVVVGVFTVFQPHLCLVTINRRSIARLNSDGSIDSSFDPNPNAGINCVALQKDGSILVSGFFTNFQPNSAPSATPINYLARLNPNGTVDTTFNLGPSSPADSIAIQDDGKILVAGNFLFWQAPGAPTFTTRRWIARINPNGTLDNSINYGFSNFVRCIVVQPDQKILLGGFFTSLGPIGGPTTNCSRIARLNADGTIDTGFNPNANGTVDSLALQADGKILIGGMFSSLQPNGATSPTTRNQVARVFADGSLDPTFDPNATDGITSVAVQADGKVLIGGGLSSLQPNGASTPTTRLRFARLENDPAVQVLEIPDGSQISWLRSGAAPELTRAFFDFSADGGSTWSPLGEATRVGTSSNWTLTGLTLPAEGDIRARGLAVGGRLSASLSLIGQEAPFSLITDPVITPLTTKGDTVPGAGIDPRIPAGALFTALYPPAINSSGQVAYRAAWKAGTQSGQGIFVAGTLAVAVGETAPDSGGATFKSLGEPQLSDGGQVAFLAITSAGTKAVFTNLGGTLRRAIAQGETLSTPVGARVKTVTTYRLSETAIDWQGRLVEGVGGVTKASDTVLHRWTPGSGTAEVLREGNALLGSTVKVFYPLAASAPGQPQDRHAGPGGGVPVLAALADKSVHILNAEPGNIVSVAQSGGTSAGAPAGTVFGSFGLPFGAGNEWIGGLVKLKTGVGGVAATNAQAILVGSTSGSYESLVARQGDAATDEAGAALAGIVYKSFKEPLFSPEGDTAFLASLAGTVTKSTDTGIWSRPAGAPAPLLLAREGSPAAEAGAGPVWAKFTALAQPTGATGTLIGGTLAGGTVNKANDAGYWGLDSAGDLRLLLREGATVDSKIVKSIHTLKIVAGSLGVTRSFNGNGEVVALVYYTNGLSAIVRVTVP
ncbi:MAG: delta-60 repeat domain-containing protein [Verrucomicrobiales bacterium]|nr:delta-60 repeat domain-containing protein [Verrucomicrobiales bacterium]